MNNQTMAVDFITAVAIEAIFVTAFTAAQTACSAVTTIGSGGLADAYSQVGSKVTSAALNVRKTFHLLAGRISQDPTLIGLLEPSMNCTVTCPACPDSVDMLDPITAARRDLLLLACLMRQLGDCIRADSKQFTANASGADSHDASYRMARVNMAIACTDDTILLAEGLAFVLMATIEGKLDAALSAFTHLVSYVVTNTTHPLGKVGQPAANSNAPQRRERPRHRTDPISILTLRLNKAMLGKDTPARECALAALAILANMSATDSTDQS